MENSEHVVGRVTQLLQSDPNVSPDFKSALAVHPEISQLRAELERVKAERDRYKILANLITFATENKDKFTESDPDGVKAIWIKECECAMQGIVKALEES